MAPIFDTEKTSVRRQRDQVNKRKCQKEGSNIRGFHMVHSRTAVGHPMVFISQTTREAFSALTYHKVNDDHRPSKKRIGRRILSVTGDIGLEGSNHKGVGKMVSDAKGYPRL